MANQLISTNENLLIEAEVQQLLLVEINLLVARALRGACVLQTANFSNQRRKTSKHSSMSNRLSDHMFETF